MDKPARTYWFPAKRYGWGWGPPRTWQGWVFLLGWLAIVIPLSPWAASRSSLAFCLFLAVMIAVLLLVCYAKGEPPRWRGSGDSRREQTKP